MTQQPNNDVPQQSDDFIREQLAQISRDVAAIDKKLVSITTSCGFCKTNIADLKATVFGNGIEGLKITSVRQSARIDSLEKAKKDDWRWLERIGTCVAVIVSVVVAIFKFGNK